MSWLLITGMGLLVVVIVAQIYASTKHNIDAHTDDGAPMPMIFRRVLTYYLLLVGSCLMYLLIALSSIDFPETTLLPESAPVEPPSVTMAPQNPPPNGGESQPPGGIGQPQGSMAGTVPDTTSPLLLRIFPQSTIGSTPTVSLALYGRNFQPESKVRFNMRERAKHFVGPELITAPLEPADLVSVGVITVDVVNPGDKASNTIAVPISKPRVPLNILGWQAPITREVQLLLLASFAGAAGSYVHAIKSLADFIGNRTLMASWFWWYIIRPFLGMAMALIFYAVLRGGFLAGTAADAKVVNPFGVVAVGALVGMFADKAAQKLGEIFDTLFTSDDPRSGKLAAPVIDALDPDIVTAGTPSPIMLKMRGDRLGKVSAVRLNADERRPNTVGEHELTLTLRPEDVAHPREITVTAVTPDGGVSPAVKLHVLSPLSIVMPDAAALPDATVGVPYQQELKASGGLVPYQWSIEPAPAWLQLDEPTGTLSGTPTMPGDTEVSVTVSDKTGESVSKTFALTVHPQPSGVG
jgi:hypothetical protein